MLELNCPIQLEVARSSFYATVGKAKCLLKVRKRQLFGLTKMIVVEKMAGIFKAT